MNVVEWLLGQGVVLLQSRGQSTRQVQWVKAASVWATCHLSLQHKAKWCKDFVLAPLHKGLC